MFREMRRKEQALSEALCREILESGKHGVLALLGDDGYPYTVAMNHACMDGKIYFHCAVEGHKIDALRSCDKASYCVINADDVDAAALTTHYRSVVAFGRARVVEDEALKRRALTAIAAKFAPEGMAHAREQIDGAIRRTGVIELSIEHLTGKESRGLANARRAHEQA